MSDLSQKRNIDVQVWNEADNTWQHIAEPKRTGERIQRVWWFPRGVAETVGWRIWLFGRWRYWLRGR